MEWRDNGVVLARRPFGETSVIVELLTADHGRHLGVVRGGRSRRLRPVLQPGNGVLATWRARIDDHLGSFLLEGSALRTADLLSSKIALHATNHLTGLARLLPERDPHPTLFHMLDAMLADAHEGNALPLQMIQFELAILAELGFGLDLSRCASTGTPDDLLFVSPRTGRAVSATAGEPFRDRLLVLPPFLRPGAEHLPVEPDDMEAAFNLTGHFLQRNVYMPRLIPAPDARRAYIALLLAPMA